MSQRGSCVSVIHPFTHRSFDSIPTAFIVVRYTNHLTVCVRLQQGITALLGRTVFPLPYRSAQHTLAQHSTSSPQAQVSCQPSHHQPRFGSTMAWYEATHTPFQNRTLSPSFLTELIVNVVNQDINDVKALQCQNQDTLESQTMMTDRICNHQATLSLAKFNAPIANQQASSVRTAVMLGCAYASQRLASRGCGDESNRWHPRN